MTERLLIVNGDDFGLSPAVNSGIIEAHERGILTSASLMVKRPASEQAAASARGRSALSVGLHLDLSDEMIRSTAVRAEIKMQLERFERLIGRAPTHLDSHHHVHRQEPVRSALLEMGERIAAPVRELTPGISYNGAFYGQDEHRSQVMDAISVNALIALIENLQPGVTELGCHPASGIDHESSYTAERIFELHKLCDPRIRSAIGRCDVILCTFGEVWDGLRGSGRKAVG